MSALFLFCSAFTALARDVKIEATAGPGGSIDPSGDVKVKKYYSQTFTITPDNGFEIEDVLVDDKSVGAVSSYRFTFLTKNHKIHATFRPRTYTITANAGEGGVIDPSGEIEVDHGKDKSFRITADRDYQILDVEVDGESKGAISTYEFSKVSSDHSIIATFILRSYTITASAGEGGAIDPSGEILVEYGSEQSFVIDANPGYEILDVVVDEDSQGALASYTFTEISSDHRIRATFDRVVQVLDVSIPNESMIIGDVIPTTIEVVDDTGIPYTMVSGSVGGYPLEGFERISATTYLASFTIIEGGNSFTATEDIPVIELVISDGEITTTPYDLPIVQDSDPIDAEAPEITRLEVPSLALGVGALVKLTISADGTGYSVGSGTSINGIAWSSSRLIFTELGGGLYELSFVVEADDANVEPGLLEASILLMDEAGNPGPVYDVLEPNSLEIYTALPEATLVGPDQICEGDIVQLSVHLRGRSPWSFDLNDGTNITSFTNITLADYKITVAPVQSTTYLLSSVLDVNGVENTDNGNLVLTVDEVTDVEIINLDAGYDVEAEPVQLEANVPGGIFSGPGVISSSGYFYPGLADTISSPHTIYYTFTNNNGCISADSALVYVLGKEGGILIPATTFCRNENPFDISVFNVPVESGSFRLLNAASEPVTGLIDHGDNTATIDPDSLEIGNYTIEYQYLDLIIHTLARDFSLESVDPPLIINLYDSSYCQNVLPFVLQSDQANATFEGQGVKGSISEGFTFTPSEADPGRIWITCTAESENGCRASTRDSILIKFAPRVIFELSSECMPEGGELVSFANQTENKEAVESWNWDFGDAGSGANNQSNLVDPSHQYQEPGLKSITLRAISFDGCSASQTSQALIDSKPVADFGWISDCFSPGSAVKFVNRTSIGSATVDTVIWTFRSSDGTVLDEIGSSSVTDTVDYIFSSPDNFQVGLYSRNSGGCFSELSKEIILRPSIQLDSDGYLESFDDTEGLWTVRSDDQVESWVWGQADFTGYSPVEGDHAWFTQLPDGVDGYTENSWIQSPCFDFREINRPLIRMELMRSFFPYLSGAVLQYREAIGDAWFTIGNETPGIGWYNVDNIINMPGGSSIGWGLEEFTPDKDWLTAIHDLDQVAGKANVDLRIVFSSNGQMEVGNQGLAVNALQIAERSKISLLEHFTNFSDDAARMADDIVDAVAISHSKDVIDLQYHLSYPGLDLLNENNPVPPFNRSGNYGFPGVPYVVLDGGVSYDFSDMESGSLKDHLRLATLEIPNFDIELNVDWQITGLEASTSITCLADRYDENIQLFLVVFESSVTTYIGGNGDTHFRNVVLDMLPTSAGKLLGNNWRKGNTDTRINTWDYKPYVEDVNDLAVVAFLQDRTSDQILQVAVDYKDETVGWPDHKSLLESLDIYPNPAKHMIYVNLGAMTENPGRIELMEMSGKAVLSEQVPAGRQVYQVDIESLHPGMYILRWVETDQVRGVSKFVKLR